MQLGWGVQQMLVQGRHSSFALSELWRSLTKSVQALFAVFELVQLNAESRVMCTGNIFHLLYFLVCVHFYMYVYV